MIDGEDDGAERAGRLIAFDLEPADPVIAVVRGVFGRSARIDGIAMDRLADERIAAGDPVLERAILEIEVERLAVFSSG